MKLHLDKVGVIENSTVFVDGLTVVTGINSSGKTTVGRVVYSIVSALGNAEHDFQISSKVFLCNKLDLIRKALGAVEVFQYRHINQIYKTDDNPVSILSIRGYTVLDLDSLFHFFNDLNSALNNLTRNEFFSILNNLDPDYNSYRDYLIKEITEDVFSQKVKEALKIWEEAYNVINVPNGYGLFIQNNIKDYLNYEFNNQIKPVKAHRAVPKIKLTDNKSVVLDLRIENKNSIVFSENSTFQLPVTTCIFIDNPFVIDKLDEVYMHRGFRYAKTNESVISNRFIEPHDRKLSKLINSDNKNFFEIVDTNNRLKNVFEKINQIVPGEFYESSEGIFYVDDGTKLSVKNLATGSKMFFIIKMLLHNGAIDEKTILVLDEPESHLHPEWINKFAEILILLINDVKVKILLTTHSPNLMLALNYYAKKSNLSNKAHFYIAEREGYYSKLKCIDDNIGEGYSHLSLPLIEMNLLLNAFDEGKNGNS